MASFGSIKQAIFNEEAKKQQYQDHIRGLNSYDRHKKFLNDYVGYYGKEKSSRETLPVKTDQDTLREGYRFIRTEEDDRNSSWEQRLVKRYYDKLFKDKIGLRWRTEKEVISGKGQCAEKLYYKKRKEEERLKQKENGKHQKKRGRSESNDDKYSDDGGSKESRKDGLFQDNCPFLQSGIEAQENPAEASALSGRYSGSDLTD
ncbi:hypothetical protein OROHE_004721 [Orobanche hederae]